MKSYTINDIRDEMNARGSHWWDRDTMRSFGTRPSEAVYQGPGGIFFVTSEKPPHGPRGYCVRQYHPADRDIDTVGGSDSLASMTRGAAHGEARRLAAMELQTQFTQAVSRLDRATNHGECRDSYGDIADARAGEWFELSSGIKCKADKWKDSAGFHVDAVDRSSLPEDQRAAIGDAWEHCREVARVLQTQPGTVGDDVSQTSAKFKELTPAQQLAHDLRQHQCELTDRQAARLISLATHYAEWMVRRCNVDVENQHAKWENIGGQIERLAAKIGAAGVQLGGDPRGCVVKLTLQDGYTNDFGKEGFCVPIREREDA